MATRKKDNGLVIVIILAAVAVLLAVVLVFLWLHPEHPDRNPSGIIEEKLRLGQKYLTELDYDNAVTVYAEVIEIDDRNTEAYVGLGDAYAGREDWGNAVENYDEAVLTIAETAGVDLTDNLTEDQAEESSGTGDQTEHNAGRGYKEENELQLVAFLNDESASPGEGVLVESFDADYIDDVLVKRDIALESGLESMYASDEGYAEMEAWLVSVGHPGYMPENEVITELFVTEKQKEDGTYPQDSERELESGETTELSGLPDTSEPAAPATDPEVPESVWKNAYAEYISNDPDIDYSSDWCFCGLIYIDDDDVPELIIEYGVEALGTRVVSYKNGETISEVFFRIGGFHYMERKGLIHNAVGLQGWMMDDFASLDNEGFHNLGMGSRFGEAMDYIHFDKFQWNGEDVSEEEFNSSVAGLFDDDQSKGWNTYNNESQDVIYTPSSMLDYLLESSDSREAEETDSLSEYFTNVQLDHIRQSLGIPDDLYVDIEVGAPFYWEGGGMDLVQVDFYHDGEIVAGAACKPYTDEITRSIYSYSE